jgi:hypothetical protein
MRSRVRLAFHPGLSNPIGADCLESRQLLSAAGHVSDAAEVGRAPAAEIAGTASRSDAASTDSVNVAAARANPAAEGDVAVAKVEQSASSAAVAAPSEGDPSSGDSTDGGSGVATIQQAVAAANAGPAVRQPTSVDATPWDEGAASKVTEAPAIEQSAGAGALIVAVAGSVGAGAAGPVPLPSGSTPFGAALAPSSASGGAWASGAGDAMLVGEIGPDRSLLANVDSTAPSMSTAVGRSAAPRLLVNPANELASTIDGDPDSVGVEPRPIEGPAPHPLSADLLTEFLPFGRASLEDAIDRFLAPLEGLGSELVHWQSPASLISATTVVATAALVWEALRRRARAGMAADEECEEDVARYPGHPAAWSIGES